jgi:hypothetical protein
VSLKARGFGLIDRVRSWVFFFIKLSLGIAYPGFYFTWNKICNVLYGFNNTFLMDIKVSGETCPFLRENIRLLHKILEIKIKILFLGLFFAFQAQKLRDFWHVLIIDPNPCRHTTLIIIEKHLRNIFFSILFQLFKGCFGRNWSRGKSIQTAYGKAWQREEGKWH